LQYSDTDRSENVRRVGEIARLFCDAGLIVVASLISPFQKDREFVRNLHLQAGLAFIEVYVKCPLEIAEARDPKGLYQMARAGHIKNFTGIDSTYELPVAPDFVADSVIEKMDVCATNLLKHLENDVRF
jgi:adenylyl-sulfate kinase